MSELTLKAIEDLLDRKFEQELEPINTKLAAIEETVSGHTTQLNNIARDVKILLEESVVTNKRLKNLETWGQKVGEKVEIKLEL